MRDADFPATRGKGASEASHVTLSEPPFDASGSVPEVRREQGPRSEAEGRAFAYAASNCVATSLGTD